MTFKTRTWGRLLLLALAVFAANDPFSDPAPAVQVQGAMPPPFSWSDIFKGPH